MMIISKAPTFGRAPDAASDLAQCQVRVSWLRALKPHDRTRRSLAEALHEVLWDRMSGGGQTK